MPQFADMSFVTVGDVKVSFLPDGGGVVEPVALYPASTQEGWKPYSALLNEDGKFITSIGAFLIESGNRKIAVDMGIGPVSIDFPGFGPFSGGRYLESVKKTGIGFDEVTDVVFTHLHLDHCGWVTQERDGERRLTFPKARYFVTEVEWEFWHGGDNPAGPHPEFVQKPLETRIEMIGEGAVIAPGISVVSTPGHTPGHISVIVSAGSERVFLTGDVLHGVMQLKEPEWSVAFDVDQELARRTRDQLYGELMRPNTVLGVNHFSNGIFGRIVQAGGERQWIPGG